MGNTDYINNDIVYCILLTLRSYITIDITIKNTTDQSRASRQSLQLPASYVGRGNMDEERETRQNGIIFDSFIKFIIML